MGKAVEYIKNKIQKLIKKKEKKSERGEKEKKS